MLYARLLTLLALVGTGLQAQSVTGTTKVKQIYLGANGAVFYDGPVLQSDILFSWNSGIFIDVWTSTADNLEKDFDKEVDVVVGFAGSAGPMKISADAGYFFVKDIDVVNANLELGYRSTFLRVEGYAPTREGGPKEGLMAVVGLRNNLSLHKNFEVVVSEWAKYDTGAFGFDEGWLIQGLVGGRLALNGQGTAILGGMRWSSPLTSVEDGREWKLVWEIGISHPF